jgi:hypothetical protein
MGAHAQEVTVQVQVTPGGQRGEPVVRKITEEHASSSRPGLGDHTLGPRELVLWVSYRSKPTKTESAPIVTPTGKLSLGCEGHRRRPLHIQLTTAVQILTQGQRPGLGHIELPVTGSREQQDQNPQETRHGGTA